MLITGIKSRPTYTVLQSDLTGRYHLLAGQGVGGDALVRLLDTMPATATVQVLYTPDGSPAASAGERLRSRHLAGLTIHSTQAALIAALDQVLETCRMGTRLYIAGSESFIGSAQRVAATFNLNDDEIQREHCGSRARRVFCIHCKALSEDVTTNIVRCGGCNRHLVVRDHYSRRLAAYMGVMADAELPGDLPPVSEAFA
jgi:hypothetical protein